MPARRKMPSDSILQKWVDDGLDHEQIRQRIHDEFHEDVALSSVSGHLSRIGLTNRVKYDDFIPWPRISIDHNYSYQLSMLRIGARLKRGLPVRELDQRRYERWRRELEEKDLVVHYSYESERGFYYVPRRPGVDTGIVRVPDAAARSVV